jgi:hypothetical protein
VRPPAPLKVVQLEASGKAEATPAIREQGRALAPGGGSGRLRRGARSRPTGAGRKAAREAQAKGIDYDEPVTRVGAPSAGDAAGADVDSRGVVAAAKEAYQSARAVEAARAACESAWQGIR